MKRHLSFSINDDWSFGDGTTTGVLVLQHTILDVVLDTTKHFYQCYLKYKIRTIVRTNDKALDKFPVQTEIYLQARSRFEKFQRLSKE